MSIYKNWKKIQQDVKTRFILDVHAAGHLLGFGEVKMASSVPVCLSNSTTCLILLLIHEKKEERKKQIT